LNKGMLEKVSRLTDREETVYEDDKSRAVKKTVFVFDGELKTLDYFEDYVSLKDGVAT